MISFMVLSAPRSASTWAANWLTTASTLCLHDPVLAYAPEELDKLYCDRRLGICCTALALLPDFVNQHPAKKVIVHRERCEVDASLISMGFSALGHAWDGALDRIHGMHVDYAELFDADAADAIHFELTGERLDRPRHRELCAMYVEPHFGNVRLRPERTRDFRRRVERAFA